MEGLEALEVISLVAKVASEIENHIGMNDRNVAEFIIAQRLEVDDFRAFKKKLAELNVDFPPSLVESIDRLVCTLHPAMRGKQQQDSSSKDSSRKDRQKQKEKDSIFKGLSMPDKQVEDTHEADEIDDALAMLEGLASKSTKKDSKPSTSTTKPSRTTRDRDSLSPRDSHRGRDRNGDKRKSRYRSRSRSPYRSPSRSRSRSRGRRRGGGRGYDDDDVNYTYNKRRRENGKDDRSDRNGRRDEPTGPLDDKPELGKIYDGHVTGIKDFGVFVNIHGVRGKVDGLVHVSALVDGQRVNHPSDVVSMGQPVKVKVAKIEDRRIGLSMKEVDQTTGEDLAEPQDMFQSGANMQALGVRGSGRISSSTLLDMDGQNGGPKSVAAAAAAKARGKKRMTSPERWEIRQLIASGVAKASDYPDLEEEYNATLTGEGNIELEEDVDIEIRDEEPPFLAGQTKLSLELSPIRVVKAPDGSLNRAAMAGAVLAKERKELRQQEADAAKAAKEQEKVDLMSQWQDPMANPEQRKFADDARAAHGGRGGGGPGGAGGAGAFEPVPEWKRIIQNKDQSFGKRTDLSMKEQRETLPIFSFREQLIKAVQDNQILIVIGETGSGKTTQLTQYLAEAGFTSGGKMVGCTQPRRVAAMSVAKRVSEEVGCPLGEEVGYTIRFEDCTSPATRIKYMTDGMLQREILLDPELKRYSVIMLDEAHERTIATDVLFGLLKKTVKRRPDLKVIATSATLDAEKFSTFFNGAPIFTIPGRTFPVEILYSREPESDYLDAALETVMQIHLTEPSGDILVFLTGQEEIDTSCEILYERMKGLGSAVPELAILPVYSALPNEVQSKIFEPAPPGGRKVILATNIAETSLTIDGIYYVVDPGFVKQNAYDPKLGMDSLVVTPISQAQAGQRAGRAGRTGPGKCFRLYTEAAYQTEMLPTTIPEIQRKNLSNTILILKAMGINDLLHFDFMDPPPINTMLSALEELYALSALDDEGLLTKLGRKMADFPMDPTSSKALIASVELGCSDEMLSIMGMIAQPKGVWYRPKDKQQQADAKKAKFNDPHGDHLTMLNVYNSWKRSRFSKPWCQEHFLQYRVLTRAKDVRTQLERIMERYKHPVVSCGTHTDRVRQALCAGFFRNASRKDPHEGFKTLIEGTPVYLHPSSALFGKQAEWVIYDTLVLTTKEYMQCTTAIDAKWLVDAAPTFFKLSPSDKLSRRRRAERIQPLYNKFQTEDDWRISAQKRSGRTGGGGGTWG
ncbi:DEAH-box ATP-dependent RNA helicase prp22 [Sporothrix bragantina]|uniref:RNA helicase n=1 Tax=Sporothrix bragantina TaxID=671064 RepID=A0ABP0AVM3_9PEZI